jgi:hypothetical protein
LSNDLTCVAAAPADSHNGGLARETSVKGWSWTFGALAVVGLWLLARPYIGVRHDGILYLGQIYFQLWPDVFRNDIFFAYGSQDQFSAFSKAAAALMPLLGLARAQLLILALCHLSLLLAASALLRPVRSVEVRVAALACLAVMPHFYGGMGIFAFAETFVTARTIAEPLALAGLAALVFDRRAIAAVLLLCAAVTHPLVALPALLVAWLVLCQQNAKWYWVALPALAAVLGGALAGVEPLNRLTQSYDAAWFAIVETSNLFVFPQLWRLNDWLSAATMVGILCVGGRVLPVPLARLATATAATGTLLTWMAVLGAGWLQNILVTQLQLWRALWLCQVLGLLFMPAVAMHLWRLGVAWRAASLSLLMLAVATTGAWPSSWAFAIWFAVTLGVARSQRPELTARLRRAIWWTSAAVLAALSLAMLASNLQFLQAKGVVIGPSILFAVLAATPALSLTFVALALKQLPNWPQPRLWGAALAVLLLGLGIHEWDRRTDHQRVFEAMPAQPHPFTLKTRPDSQVYWRESLLTSWAMLGRPSFFTDQQGSGVLFNRATAMEFSRRQKLLAPLSFQREICTMLAGLGGNGQWEAGCVPDEELITKLCAAPRGPDFLVFPFAFKRGVVAEWTFTPRDAAPTTYYLHDCTLLR